MNIICDYCGSKIDTSKHNTCPYCGASYHNNQSYNKNAKRQEEIEELKLKDLKENQELEHQKKKLELENAKVDLKHKKQKSPLLKGCLIALIVIAVVIIGFFLLCAYIVNLAVKNDTKTPDTQQTEITTTAEPEFIEVPVSGGINEPLSTSKYTITLTELKPADKPWHWNPAKGNMYIAVHFVIENINDEEFICNDNYTCQADGFLANAFPYSQDIYIQSKRIPAGMKIDGYRCFEVPIDTKEFTITYDDLVTFTIENTITNTEENTSENTAENTSDTTTENTDKQ